MRMKRGQTGKVLPLVSSGLVALTLTISEDAMANERQGGWGIQFFEEEGVVFPLAMLDSIGEPSEGGSLFLACDFEGPVVFYQDRFATTAGTLDMEIQSRDEVLSVTFQLKTVPYFGHRLRLEADASREFLWAFTASENAAVEYRSGSRAGIFPTVGTDRIVDIFESNCAL